MVSPSISSENRGGVDYQLRSDLAQFCLPASQRDSNLKYAWANSICFLFVLIGTVGIRMPVIEMKPVSVPEELIPVVFTPPVEEQKIEPQKVEELPEPSQDAVADTPVVATVVAANPAAASFAVPVEGPVILTSNARMAQAPPSTPPPKAASQPRTVVFNPKANDGGYYPEMSVYPKLALDRGEEGDGAVFAVITEKGVIESIKIQESSGSVILDRAFLEWVRTRYRFPAGAVRHFVIPFGFKIQR